MKKIYINLKKDNMMYELQNEWMDIIVPLLRAFI